MCVYIQPVIFSEASPKPPGEIWILIPTVDQLTSIAAAAFLEVPEGTLEETPTHRGNPPLKTLSILKSPVGSVTLSGLNRTPALNGKSQNAKMAGSH